MTERRIEPEELEDLTGLEPGDPRLREADSPPRVRAVVRAYRDFLAPGEVPGDARVADAEARLRNVLEREIGVPLGDDDTASHPWGERVGPSAGAGREPSSGSPGLSGWFRRAMLPRGFRSALAVAGLIVVSGTVWIAMDRGHEGGDPIMRGDGPTATEDVLTPKPVPERLDDGSVRLEWSSSGEADRYAVIFLAADLEELARVENLPEPRLELSPGALPAGLRSGREVLWLAVALRGIDEVARSPAQPITIP